MDFGGRPSDQSIPCGYADTLIIFADHADWGAPSWYSGDVTVDATMDSPFECQARCAQTDECDYFSYEWEETPMNSGNYYHECYLKMSYDNPNSSADAACEIPAGPPPIWYVEWGSQDVGLDKKRLYSEIVRMCKYVRMSILCVD